MRILLALLMAFPLAPAARSAETSTDPVRIAADGISLEVPDGWRQLQSAEADELRPKVKPQNEMQRRMVEGQPTHAPLIMKHDVAGDTLAASAQAMRQPLGPKLKFASSIEVARVMAAMAIATYHGNLEVEPRELTVSGLPAAEFMQRYEIVDGTGTHPMRSHMVIVSRRTYYVLIGYAGPADDMADADTFTNVIVKSAKIDAK